jgi:hypothetical protein
MATERSKYDPLRNPEVDYERADLSAKGIVLFLVGLLVAGVFIELVLWGMFRFMAKSDVLFPQSQPNPMMSARKLAPAPAPRSVLQNNPAVDIMVFPEPRLQTGDAADMNKFLNSQQKTLNPDQPFMDQSGTVHIPISQAMKLIEERGLPVRPNAPPPEVNTQTDAGNTKMLNVQGEPLAPETSGMKTQKAEGKNP